MGTRVSAAITGIVLFAASASGQTTGGALRGTIKDQQGAPLAGVQVTAVSPDSPTPSSAVSDSMGRYRLPDLAPGTYRITAELENFATWAHEGVVVSSGVTIAMAMSMTIGARAEVVDVKADTPLLETSSAVQAMNISGDMQRSTPIAGRRDWADSLLLAPGVAVTETRSLGPNPFFLHSHGADLASNVFQIDGVDVAPANNSVGQYISLSTEAIQDVQVKVGGLDASDQLGMGASLRVTTKAGTDVIKGTASVVARGSSWNDNNVPGGTPASFSLLQPDLSLGGPILRGRLWFFGAYRRLNASANPTRTATQLNALKALTPDVETGSLSNTGNVSFVKLSTTLSDSQRLSGYFQRDRTPIQDGGADKATFGSSIYGGNAFATRLSSTWNPRLTSEINIGYNDKSSSGRPGRSNEPTRIVYQSAALSGGRLVGTGRLANYGASASGATDIVNSKLTITGDTTYLLPDVAGIHQLKAGVFLQPRLNYTLLLNYVNGGTAEQDLLLRNSSNLADGARAFRIRTYDAASTISTDVHGADNAVYVQDTWNPINRVTVNAGLRVDLIRKYDDQFAATTQRSTEVAPRVGTNIMLTNDARHVVRASWGRIHEMVSANWVSLGSAALGYVDRYDIDGDGVFETSFVTPGSTVLTPNRLLDSALHQPYVNELNVGYKVQLPGATTLDIGYVDRVFDKRMTIVETNGIYTNGLFKGYRNETQNEIYEITNDIWAANALRQIDVIASKQTKTVRLIASYSRQWRRIKGGWQPNDPASFIQPDAFADTRGLGRQYGVAGPEEVNSLSGTARNQSRGTAGQWRDHIAKVAVVYAAPWRMQVAMSMTAESGPWSGPVVLLLPAPDPRFGPSTVRLSNGRVVSNPLATVNRFPGPTRDEGQFTLPFYQTVDIRVGRLFLLPFGQLELAAEGFNLGNRGAAQLVVSGGNVMGTSTFGQGATIQEPRSAQVSARFSF